MADQDMGINVTAMIDDAINQLKELYGTLNELPDNVNINLDATDNLSPATEEANQSIQNLGDSAANTGSEITDGMSQAADSMNDVTNTGKDASDAVNDLGAESEATGDIATDSFLLAEGALAGLATGAYLAAEKVGEMNATINKMSGGDIDSGEMRDLVASTMDVTMNAEEATTYMKQLKRLGVSSAEDLRENTIALNNMQEAYRMSSDEANQMAIAIVAMGGDASNLEASFNAVSYASSNMANGYKDVIKFAQIFGPEMENMGLTVDQQAIVMVQAQKKFGPTMKEMRKGMREAFRESKGDIKEFEKQLGLESGALAKATEKTNTKSGAIKKMADDERKGKNAVDEFFSSLDKLQLKLGDVLQPIYTFAAVVGGGGAFLGALDLAAKGIDKLYPEIGGRLDKFFGKTGDEAGKGLSGYYRRNMVQFAQTIRGSYDAHLRGPLESMWGRVRNFFDRPPSKLTPLDPIKEFKGIKQPVQMDDAGKITKGTGDLFGWGGVTESAEKAAQTSSKFETVTNKIRQGLDWVIGGLSKFKGLAVDVFDRIIGKLGLEALGKLGAKIGGRLLPVLDVALTIKDVGDVLRVTDNQFKDNPLYNFIKFFTELIPITGVIVRSGDALNAAWDAFQNISKGGDVLQNISNVFKVFSGAGAFGELGKGINFDGISKALVGGIQSLPSIIMIILQRSAHYWGLLIGTFIKGPGRIYNAVKDIPHQIYSRLLQIPNRIQAAGGMIYSQLGNMAMRFYRYGANILSNFRNGIISQWNNVIGMINRIPTLWNQAIAWLKGLPGTLYNLALNAYNSITKGISDAMAGIKAMIDQVYNTIMGGIQWLIDLPGKAYQWGYNLIEQFKQGIYDALNKFKAFFESLLGALFSSIKSASPPREGPLKEVDKWGKSFGGTYAENVASGLSEGIKKHLREPQEKMKEYMAHQKIYRDARAGRESGRDTVRKYGRTAPKTHTSSRKQETESLQININGPVKIRDDMDIRKLATHVSREVNRQATRHGAVVAQELW